MNKSPLLNEHMWLIRGKAQPLIGKGRCTREAAREPVGQEHIALPVESTNTEVVQTMK
jgi:hypothetical protein